MSQPTLFERDHSRNTDPAPSHKAARKISRHASSHKERVIACLRDYGCPLTTWEIAAILEMRPDQVWKRISDLKRDGRVAAQGERRNPHGNPSTTWGLV